MSARFPTFYLTHGGGPWPYMNEEARRPYARLEQSLRELPRQLPQKPQAILDTDAIAIFDELGFREHLTPQRSNGLRSMVERIRNDAREVLATAA